MVHVPSLLVGSAAAGAVGLAVHEQISHRSRLSKKSELRGKRLNIGSLWFVICGVLPRIFMYSIVLTFTLSSHYYAADLSERKMVELWRTIQKSRGSKTNDPNMVRKFYEKVHVINDWCGGDSNLPSFALSL